MSDKYQRLLSAMRKFGTFLGREADEADALPEAPPKLVAHKAARLEASLPSKAIYKWSWGLIPSSIFQTIMSGRSRLHPFPSPLPYGAKAIEDYGPTLQAQVVENRMQELARVFEHLMKEMIHRYGPAALRSDAEVRVVLQRSIREIKAPDELVDQIEIRSSHLPMDPFVEVKLIYYPIGLPGKPLCSSTRFDSSFLAASGPSHYIETPRGSKRWNPPADLPEGPEPEDFATTFQSWAKGSDD